MRSILVAAVWLMLTLFSGRATAQVEGAEPSARDIVLAYNTGLRLSIAPGIFIPTHGGQVGFSIGGDVRYGFVLRDSVVLAPGLRVAGYFPPHESIVMGLGTVRLTIPAGPVGPFVVGGVGPGWVSQESAIGVAYLAGGGFMVHIGMSFGIGVEATYQAITSTEFAVVSVGPLLLLAF